MAAPALAPEYDPFCYEQDVDPYPIYRALRDHAPVYHNERLGFWALTRFDDCLAAFLDPATFSSARGTVLELMDLPSLPPIMIFMDPPRHTRMRGLVSRVFTPRRMSPCRAVAYICGHTRRASSRPSNPRRCVHE